MNYVAALAMCVTAQGYQKCDLMPQPFYSLDECRSMRDIYRNQQSPIVEYFCVIRNENGALVRKE
jgi:hypothetical protein